MVYCRKSPALFIIGLIMLAIWYMGDSGMLSGYIDHLGGKKYKYGGEISTLALYFGLISVVFGLLQWLGPQNEGDWDYFTATLAGGMFILIIAMLVRWFVAPEVAVISKSFGKVGDTGKYIHKLFGLNYIVMGIITGIIIVNVFKHHETINIDEVNTMKG